MLRSGWIGEGGLKLVGVNASDGIWNLALIEELKHHFPPDHPGFAGQPLKAYHFLYHLLLANISKITFIPVINLYFHIFPLIISFLWGYGVYLVVYEWFKSKQAAVWSVFFSFFGGSFAVLLPLIGQGKLSMDSGFGIAQPFSSSLVNPAFASSVILVIWAFYALLRYLKTQEKRWAFLLILTSGLAVGFKAYAGMILLGTLGVVGVWRIIFERKVDLLLYCFIAILLALLVFLPFNANYGFLVWAPFWPLHRVMQGPLNFTNWDELWLQYSQYMDYFGILKLEFWAFILFFFGNLGTRIIAFPAFRKFYISDEHVHPLYVIYYLTTLAISFFIPMFFLQPTGGGFNIIQMYWYFLFLVSLLVGPGIMIFSKRIKSSALKYTFYFLVLVLTIPTSASVLKEAVYSQGSSIDSQTLELLNFLKDYKDYNATVLEIPNLESYDYKNLESWFWRSGVLIPALGGHRVYVADEVVSFAYEDKERRLEVLEQFMRPQTICNQKDQNKEVCQKALLNSFNLLKREKITLIYSPGEIFWLDKWKKLRLLFSNSMGKIYEVLSV